jgi:hypothetical protein
MALRSFQTDGPQKLVPRFKPNALHSGFAARNVLISELCQQRDTWWENLKGEVTRHAFTYAHATKCKNYFYFKNTIICPRIQAGRSRDRDPRN